MPDIGQALREARARRRIDINQVESATKIRAKYLRALENEEWDALPGPTFVKTFLRTYADYLGLDARSLVEEYKLRYERPFGGELTPLSPMRPGLRQRRRRRIWPWLALLAVVAAIAGGLWLLGRDQAGRDAGTDQPPTATETPGAGAGGGQGASVALRIAATRTTRICVVDARGREVLSGRRLLRGRSTGVLRSSRFRVGFQGGSARMTVGGRRYTVTPRGRMIGFELRPASAPRSLPRRRVPDCR